jgi:hypothetical protein
MTFIHTYVRVYVLSFHFNIRSSIRRQEQQPVQEFCTYSQQPLAGAASAVEAAVVSSISSSSLWQEQQPLAGAAVAVAAEAVAEQQRVCGAQS